MFEFEVSKPTSDCQTDSVRVLLPYKDGEIDTLRAVKVRTGKEMHGWINHSYEYWQLTLVGFKCGEYQILTQAFIYSFHGGQPLITPGLFDVRVYPELSMIQKIYMTARNRTVRFWPWRRLYGDDWTEIDAMYFCND